MPAALRVASAILPLSHAIDIARPLLAGTVPNYIVLHLAVLLVYACGAYYVALVFAPGDASCAEDKHECSGSNRCTSYSW